jgi:pilus assembly protein CpaB
MTPGNPVQANRIALLVAAVVASVGALLLVLYLRRFEEEASGGAPVKVLMAVKALEPGALLTEDAVAVRAIPVAYVESRAVRESDRAKVVGLRVATPVQANQSLFWTDLAIATDDRRDLSSLVQPGMRAVTIRAANDDKSFALIRPGDRVDVIATVTPNGGPVAPGGEKTSVVLLQNVLVLAVGLETGQDAPATGSRTAGDSRQQVMSLSLNLQEAQLVSLALDRGRLTVALRNPGDLRVTEGMSDLTSSALVESNSRKAIQNIRQSVASDGPIRLEAR